MKDRTPEQLKGQIRNFATKRNLQPQEVLQMFLLERVLERIAKSPYKDNFILKGGFLISSMFGVEGRTTMDMDTTVTGIEMKEDEIHKKVTEILSIDVDDGIEFQIINMKPIREDDAYNNFRVYFVAHYGKIANEMKLDITTGDVITPRAIDYSYKTILDEDQIEVKAYNRETIIAEKYETIIRRNIGSTRARDFYDLYMFFNLFQEVIDYNILKSAVARTSEKRGSQEYLADWRDICDEMSRDLTLKSLWENYRDNNSYSAETSFEDVLKAVREVGRRVSTF